MSIYSIWNKEVCQIIFLNTNVYLPLIHSKKKELNASISPFKKHNFVLNFHKEKILKHDRTLFLFWGRDDFGKKHSNWKNTNSLNEKTFACTNFFLIKRKQECFWGSSFGHIHGETVLKTVLSNVEFLFFFLSYHVLREGRQIATVFFG